MTIVVSNVIMTNSTSSAKDGFFVNTTANVFVMRNAGGNNDLFINSSGINFVANGNSNVSFVNTTSLYLINTNALASISSLASVNTIKVDTSNIDKRDKYLGEYIVVAKNAAEPSQTIESDVVYLQSNYTSLVSRSFGQRFDRLLPRTYAQTVVTQYTPVPTIANVVFANASFSFGVGSAANDSGYYSVIQTTTDAVNWEDAPSANVFANGAIYAYGAYINNVAVYIGSTGPQFAVAPNGFVTTTAGPNSFIQSSTGWTSGSGWSNRTKPNTASSIVGLTAAYVGATSKFVAMGYNYHYVDDFGSATVSNTSIITSTNAVTWTQSTTLSAATYSTPKAIAAANDLFLIVSDSDIAKSTDAITWANLGVSGGAYYSVAYGNATFVLAGGNGNIAIIPASDVTSAGFTDKSINATSVIYGYSNTQANSLYDFNRVSYGNGLFYVWNSEFDQPYIYVSKDNGNNWFPTRIHSENTQLEVKSITFTGVAGAGGSYIFNTGADSIASSSSRPYNSDIFSFEIFTEFKLPTIHNYLSSNTNTYVGYE